MTVKIATPAPSLRAQLDEFTIAVMEICSKDPETVKFAQDALAQGMHPGMVSDMLGFDMWDIIQDFTQRLQRVRWWQLLRIRKRMRKFYRNSFVYLFEQMLGETEDVWYEEMGDIIGTMRGVIGEDLARKRAMYRAMHVAYELPEWLKTRNSYLNDTSPFLNVLFILQEREHASIIFEDSPQPIQPWIDQHITDLRALWAALPSAPRKA